MNEACQPTPPAARGDDVRPIFHGAVRIGIDGRMGDAAAAAIFCLKTRFLSNDRFHQITTESTLTGLRIGTGKAIVLTVKRRLAAAMKRLYRCRRCTPRRSEGRVNGSSQAIRSERAYRPSQKEHHDDSKTTATEDGCLGGCDESVSAGLNSVSR